MFWRQGRKREIEANKAREREAFLRRIREVLDRDSADFEPAVTSAGESTPDETPSPQRSRQAA
jgi:hypothetical protein